MECRVSVSAGRRQQVMLAMVTVILMTSSLQSASGQRRRVVIEVPVHVRSHQHTHTVYRPIPAEALVRPNTLVHPHLVHPSNVVVHPGGAQRVAHHAAPGGLTSITLVNLGRPHDAAPAAPAATPAPAPEHPDAVEEHRVAGIAYHHTEHTAQVYR